MSEMPQNGGSRITGGCREVDNVACYTRHVDSDQTLCVQTMAECEKAVVRDRGEIGKPENVSDCISLDRSFQH